MTKYDKDWEAHYRELQGGDEIATPARVLSLYQHLLPSSGEALDLACGLAGNAFYLAQRGMRVHAWDSSNVAIEKVRRLSQQAQLNLTAEVTDVEKVFDESARFDVIVVSRFLFRPLFPKLIQALKPGGLLYYQTFVKDKAEEVGPRNPDYLLDQNELLQAFSQLRILAYHEEGTVGDISQGKRNEAMLVGQRLQE